jgi:two-component system, OmpR family, response regulator RegX3
MSGAPASTASSCPSPNGVLVVSSAHEDHDALRRILRRTHRTYSAGSCGQALDRLSRGGIAVVFCDSDLPDGSWMDISNLISSQAEPPLLIVATRTVDRRLWAEVLNLGGFDVIAKPFDAREVEHVVRTAWACRYSPCRARHFAAAG